MKIHTDIQPDFLSISAREGKPIPNKSRKSAPPSRKDNKTSKADKPNKSNKSNKDKPSKEDLEFLNDQKDQDVVVSDSDKKIQNIGKLSPDVPDDKSTDNSSSAIRKQSDKPFVLSPHTPVGEKLTLNPIPNAKVKLSGLVTAQIVMVLNNPTEGFSNLGQSGIVLERTDYIPFRNALAKLINGDNVQSSNKVDVYLGSDTYTMVYNHKSKIVNLFSSDSPQKSRLVMSLDTCKAFLHRFS